MDADDNSPGTVCSLGYAAVRAAVAARWSGGSRSIAVAGVMAMTWGDAGGINRQANGTAPIPNLGSERSWENSAAMFVASAVAMFLVLLLPGSLLSPQRLIVRVERSVQQ